MDLLRSINADVQFVDDIYYTLNEGEFIKKGLGKLAGAVGMKKTAANLQAQGDAEQQIKQLNLEFAKFAGQMGKKAGEADVSDLSKFFQSKRLPVSKELKSLKQDMQLKVVPGLKQAFAHAVQQGARRSVNQQAMSNPTQQRQQKQGQQQQSGGNLTSVLKSLSPQQKDGLIQALQGG